jgi:uncharacterized protein (DUF983 family)
MTTGPPRLATILARGARGRCPRCGHGALFVRWIKLHDQCAVCGLRYLANQGDLWGYLLFADRALFIFPIIVVLYFRLYTPGALVILATGMAGTLIATMPLRTGIAVGLEYYQRTQWEEES